MYYIAVKHNFGISYFGKGWFGCFNQAIGFQSEAIANDMLKIISSHSRLEHCWWYQHIFIRKIG